LPFLSYEARAGSSITADRQESAVFRLRQRLSCDHPIWVYASAASNVMFTDLDPTGIAL